jgi:membrane protease YdiL (CAAX protease family)
MFHSAPFAVILSNLLALVGGLGLTWLLSRFIDRRSFADFGLRLDRKWWLDVGFGSILGAFLMTGVFLSMRVLGWVSITGTAATNSALPFRLAFLLRALFFAVVAVNEELAFRGYQLKNLSEGFAGNRIGPRRAIIGAFLCSSLFFGLLHLTSENATLFSALTVFLAGLLLALPYLVTGELGLSIGLHFTWNFFEGTVYGFPVSGASPGTHLLSIQQTGPSLWTGGAFGPEAGLLGLVWILLGCGLILWWIKWLRKQVNLYTPLASYAPKHDNKMEYVFQ